MTTAADPSPNRSPPILSYFMMGPIFCVIGCGMVIGCIAMGLTVPHWLPHYRPDDTFRNVLFTVLPLVMAVLFSGGVTSRFILYDDCIKYSAWFLPMGTIRFEKVTDKPYVEAPHPKTKFQLAGLTQLVFPYPNGKKHRIAVPKRLVDDFLNVYRKYEKKAVSSN